MPASFDLDSNRPIVTVAATYSKRRKEDKQPLPPSVAAELCGWLATKPVNLPVWPGSWKNHAAKMIRKDLAAAGIPFSDEAGKVFDFHALRHHYISSLTAAGIRPKVAQELARHSDIKLTMQYYTHLELNDISEAVGQLPALPPTGPEIQQQRATGTDGKLAQKLALTSDIRFPKLSPLGQTNEIADEPKSGNDKTLGTEKCQGSSSVIEGAGRSRTDDGGFAIRCLSLLATAPALIWVVMLLPAHWPRNINYSGNLGKPCRTVKRCLSEHVSLRNRLFHLTT